MFLPLNHKKLAIYSSAKELLKECYLISSKLPPEEKFNLCQQIKRASLSVILNLSEGSSRKSEVERKRYYEISRGSVIEIDTAAEVIFDLKYLDEKQLENLGKLLNRCFALLSNMIK